ncbi:MAG: hypothetical protein ACK47B_06690 [Armatimonadota bacterium]
MALQLICSISAVSRDCIEEVLPFTASDDNVERVRRLYGSTGLQYPSQFACLIATSSPAKPEWIAAFGLKRQANVRRVTQMVSPAETAITGSSVLKQLNGSGIVIVTVEELLDEVAVAAPGDISDIASKSGQSLVDLSAMATREEKRRLLLDLERRAKNTYCEARIHRPLIRSDIKEVFSLSEFHRYTRS